MKNFGKRDRDSESSSRQILLNLRTSLENFEKMLRHSGNIFPEILGNI